MRGERVVVSSFNYGARRWHGVCASRLYVPFFLVVGEGACFLIDSSVLPSLVFCGLWHGVAEETESEAFWVTGKGSIEI
jgi:hypothetical protein